MTPTVFSIRQEFLGFPELTGYHQWQKESQIVTTRTNLDILNDFINEYNYCKKHK